MKKSLLITFVLLLATILHFSTAVYSQNSDDCIKEMSSPFAIDDGFEGSSLKELKAKKNQLQQEISNIKKYCPNFEEWKKHIEDAQKVIDENLQKLRDVAQKLKESDGINIQYPTDCRVSSECCQGGTCCSDLDPCKYEDFQKYLDRLKCMKNEAYQETSSATNNFMNGGMLVPRWYSGRDHREFMGAYNDIFNAVLGLLNVFDNILSELEGKDNPITDIVEEEILKIAKSIPMEGIKAMASPEELKAIEDAQSAYETIQAFKSIVQKLKNGGASPAWVIQLNQMLYTAAANATAVAVEGWKDYANLMSGYFQSSYQKYLCSKKLFANMLQAMEACKGFCKRAEECHRKQLEEVQAEISGMRKRAGIKMTQTEDGINSLLKQHLEGQKNDCKEICEQGGTIVIPDNQSPVGQRLSQLLQRRYGNWFCWMRVKVTANCSGTSCSFTTLPELSMKEPFHKECCKKLPPETATGGNPSSGGTTSGGGTSIEGGGHTTAPPIEGGLGTGSGSEGGNSGGSSNPGGGHTSPPDPDHPDSGNPPNQPKSCKCIVPTVFVNGMVALAGSTFHFAPSAVNIQVFGHCVGKDCKTGKQSVKVKSPNGLIQNGANSLKANLQNFGMYQVVAKQICNDEVCPLKFKIEILDRPSRNQSHPSLNNNTPSIGNCGNDDCLNLEWKKQGQKTPYMPFADAILNLSPTQVLDLQVKSQCLNHCNVQQKSQVEWIIETPSGRVISKQGYQLTFDFAEVGVYKICLIERMICGQQKRKFSRTFLVNTN